jgi:D-alanyl-D-alanine carboxypeptidase
MDASTGIILYQKNIDKKEFPASITKVMTALVALEASEGDLSKRISFSRDAIFSLPYDSSSIAMNEGDSLSLEESLHGLLLASANEVANAMAESIGGTQEEFIDMMNSKAESLGAKNTHFINPNGLHDDNHYTSARDMALFMREAVKNPTFLELIATKYYDIPPTETQPLIRPLNNSNKMIQPGQYFNEFVIGGKTGYTDEAKHTLVNYAVKGDIKLITVVMHADKNQDYNDTNALLSYGFDSYRNSTLFDGSSLSESCYVIPDAENPDSSVAVPLRTSEVLQGMYPASITENSVDVEITLPEKIYAPVKEGDALGILSISYQGVPLGEIKLYAQRSVNPAEKVVPVWNEESAPIESTEAPSYVRGFSMGFAGEIFSSAVSSLTPLAVDPFYSIIAASVLTFITLVFLISSVIHFKRRDREKDLLRYINRDRKKVRI